MVELIDENSGLKGQYAEMFAAAWKRGRYLAVKRMSPRTASWTSACAHEEPSSVVIVCPGTVFDIRLSTYCAKSRKTSAPLPAPDDACWNSTCIESGITAAASVPKLATAPINVSMSFSEAPGL